MAADMNKVIREISDVLNKNGPLHPVELSQVAAYLMYWCAKGYTDDKVKQEINLLKNETNNKKQFAKDFVELMEQSSIESGTNEVGTKGSYSSTSSEDQQQVNQP